MVELAIFVIDVAAWIRLRHRSVSVKMGDSVIDWQFVLLCVRDCVFVCKDVIVKVAGCRDPFVVQKDC